MSGRVSVSALVVVALSSVALTGCERPRVKSYESIESATHTNPPRDFAQAPLDPYSWGGIASASGGRDPGTSYGAMAPGTNDGATQIYKPLSAEETAALARNDSFNIYLVPDPRNRNLVGQYLASAYIGNEKDAVWTTAPGIKTAQPPRAGIAKVAPPAPEPASGE